MPAEPSAQILSQLIKLSSTTEIMRQVVMILLAACANNNKDPEGLLRTISNAISVNITLAEANAEIPAAEALRSELDALMVGTLELMRRTQE